MLALPTSCNPQFNGFSLMSFRLLISQSRQFPDFGVTYILKILSIIFLNYVFSFKLILNYIYSFIFVRRFVIFGLCALIAALPTSAEKETPSLWDLIPVVSQAKTFFQALVGDVQGAVQTQKNYAEQGLGSSQVKSFYHLSNGDPGKAWDIQKKSLSNFEQVVDGLPVVGHIKGGIHLLTGDHDHGWQALKSATSTSGTVIGGVLGGPIGALGGHFLTDAAISGADYILNGNKSQLHGLINYYGHLNDMKSGDHFDALLGLALDQGLPGALKTKTTLKNSLPVNAAEHFSKKMPKESFGYQPLVNEVNTKNHKTVGAPADSSNKMPKESFDYQPLQVNEKNSKIQRIVGAPADLKQLASDEPGPSSRVDTLVSEQEDADKANVIRVVEFENLLRTDPMYRDLGLFKAWNGEISQESLVKMDFDGLDSFEHNENLDGLDIDSLKSKLKHLTPDEKSLVDKYDFRTVNTEKINTNCLPCTLSVLAKLNIKMVRDVVAENLEPDGDILDTDDCLKALENGKFINFEMSDRLDGLNGLDTYLKENAETLENKPFMLEMAHNTDDPSEIVEGHAVVMKYKMVKDNPNPVKVIIDYQFPGFVQPDVPNPFRFQTFINTEVYDFYFITHIDPLKE